MAGCHVSCPACTSEALTGNPGMTVMLKVDFSCLSNTGWQDTEAFCASKST